MGRGSILVIDDEEVICDLIRNVLTRKDFSVTTASESKKGVGLAEQKYFDAILVDLQMPGVDGIKILEKIKAINPDNTVIIITGYPSFETAKEALHSGAFDYLVKPFDLEELTFIVNKAVAYHRLTEENKKMAIQIAEDNINLEKKVLEKAKDMQGLYEELQATYMNTIKALAKALDAKDQYTHSHSENVTKYAMLIAREMGLSEEDINNIKDACELHDIGKIGIDDYILNKAGKLTKEEWDQIKLHPQKGAEILKPLKFLNGIVDVVVQHHEKYNGSGYPDGLKAEQIKLGARIIAVADAYDAMASERPYRKKAFSKEEAISEIKKHSGTQFDPKVVAAFLRVVDKF